MTVTPEARKAAAETDKKAAERKRGVEPKSVGADDTLESVVQDVIDVLIEHGNLPPSVVRDLQVKQGCVYNRENK